MLDIDSPDGQANGISEFAAMIRGADKPVTAVVGGTCASAAYRLGAAANSIVRRELAFGLLTANGAGSDQHIRQSVLCFLLNDAIKDGMRRAAAEMPYPAPEGLPRAERLKKLEALDKKIAKLEGELVDLHREADAVGVPLRSEPALPGKLKA